MSSYTSVGYEGVPQKIRDTLDGLLHKIGLAFEEACSRGSSDVLMHVHVEKGQVRIRAYDRNSYQKNLLMSDPKDSAESDSFFEVINRSLDGKGFWVVLEVDGEPDEYLLSMAIDQN